jgi:deoxycytidylate deaminase
MRTIPRSEELKYVHLDMIEEAAKIASRSCIRTHKTGAIIADKWGNIISNGWSHVPTQRIKKRSLHAELHALARGRHSKDLRGAYCYVATLGGKSGNVTDARPCLHCAIALRAAGIIVVRFTQRKANPGVMVLEHELAANELKVYSDRDSS